MRKIVIKSFHRVCLFAWQTNDWNKLSKSKFHPRSVKNSMGGYLFATYRFTLIRDPVLT